MKVIELIGKLIDMPMLSEVLIDIEHCPNCNKTYALYEVDNVLSDNEVYIKIGTVDLYARYKEKRETGIETVTHL